jgi:hypothetical protein
MRGNTIGRVLFVALLAITYCATLSASPLFGTFNIGGTVIATPTTITWRSDVSPSVASQAVVGATGLSGSFLALSSGEVIGIASLNSAGQPSSNPDAPFTPPVPFISFTGPLAGITLNINEVFHGFEGAAGCAATTPSVGQVCTVPGVNPPAGTQSPFNFVNNPPPAPNGPAATATFAFSGVTSDGLSRWSGNFTSQFNVPFQTILHNLTAGPVSNTFSATITVTALTGAPEPGSMALMGLGVVLVVLSAGLRRRPFGRRH